MSLWATFYEEGMPDLLCDMRVVQEWPIRPNPVPKDEVRLDGLRELYTNDYLKFRDRLEKLEIEWMQLKRAKLESMSAKSPSEWDGKGPCPTCKHEATPVDLNEWKLDELLENILGGQE